MDQIAAPVPPDRSRGGRDACVPDRSAFWSVLRSAGGNKLENSSILDARRAFRHRNFRLRHFSVLGGLAPRLSSLPP